MQKIKTLSNIHFRPEPLLRETSIYLKLHIVANQMERLNSAKETYYNKIELADKRLEVLQKRYDALRDAVDV